MNGIILKDLYDLKKGSKSSFFVMIIIILYPIIIGNRDSWTMLWSIGVFITTYSSLVYNTIFYDDKSGLLANISGYPISKKHYVMAKYNLNLLIHLFVFIISTLLLIFFYKMVESMSLLYLILSIYFIMSQVNIIATLKYKNYGIAITNLGVFFVIFLIGYKLIDGNLEKVINMVSNTNYKLIIITSLFNIFAYIFCQKLSIKTLEVEE